MTVSTRVSLRISAAAALFGLALTPAAFAQDAMQQDIDFKNSLSQGHDVQGSRYQEKHDVRERHPQQAEKARRHEKGRHVELVVRR